ncbi:MAG: hypothetical protein ACOC1K_00525 [Nanoarchaeota archaeon]
MNRQEKNKIKRIVKIFHWLFVISLLLFFVNIGLFSADLIPLPLGEEYIILRAIIILLSVMIPVIGAVIFNLFYNINIRKIFKHIRNVNDKRNNFKISKIWESIEEKDYEKMKMFYNSIPNGSSFRVLANGMITTALKLSNDEKKKNVANKRFIEFLY